VNPNLVSDLLIGAAACAYACSAAGFFVHLLRRRGAPRAARAARWLLIAAVALHAVFIVQYSLASRTCPVKTINLGVSLGAIAAALVYLAARRWLKIDGLGVFIAPIAFAFLLAGRFVGIGEVPSTVQSRLLPLHIAANVLGDSFFLLASGAAVLYLVQARQLKAKRGAPVFGRLPPLDALDRAAHGFLVVGFPLTTFGALSGTVWISKLHAGGPTAVLRVLLGYVAWVVFAGVLLLRLKLGWRGKRAAFGTLAGFALALVVLALYFVKSGAMSP
jgi:ABC-type uncharacterized transport system permease subunit